ncbi:MAG: MFS transporter [Anaerolineales bacterium]|nr:MFS transporter [Anaerolineales bacterium]
MTITQKRNQTIGYYASFVGLGMASAALGPALPYLAEKTGSLIGEVSILFSTQAAGYLLGSIVGGRLYDRLPGHLVALVAMVGIGVTLGLTPLIPLLWSLSAVLFILGMMQGALDVGCNAMLVWVHGSQVGPYMNALHLFFGLGTFIAPIIIAQSVLLTGEIDWGFGVMGLLVMPVALWVFRTASPSAPTAESEDGGRTNTKLLILIVAFMFLYVGAELGFGGWIFTYALKQNLANETTGAYLNSAYWGAFTLGRLLGIPIAARVRPRWILLGDLLGAIFSLVLIILFPESALVLWVGSILLGLFVASVFPVVVTLAERRMTLTGTVTSWFLVGASAGSMFLPWLMGQFFEIISPLAILYIILVDLILSLGVYTIVMRVSEPVEQSERVSPA